MQDKKNGIFPFWGIYFESPSGEVGDGSGDGASGSSGDEAGDDEVLIDNEVLGLGDGDGDKHKDHGSDKDSAASGVSQAELMSKIERLEKDAQEWKDRFGKQTDELGSLRKKLSRDSSSEGDKDGAEGDGGSAENASLKAQVSALEARLDYVSQNVATASNYLEQQRLAEEFSPEERAAYEPRVQEMAAGITSGTISLESVLNFAVRGERVRNIVLAAEKRGMRRQLEALSSGKRGAIPTSGSASMATAGVGSGTQRKQMVDADEALATMYPEKFAAAE